MAEGKTKKIIKSVEKIDKERPKIRKAPDRLIKKEEISKEIKKEAEKGKKRKKGVKKSKETKKKQERKRKNEKERKVTLDTFDKRKKV